MVHISKVTVFPLSKLPWKEHGDGNATFPKYLIGPQGHWHSHLELSLTSIEWLLADRGENASQMISSTSDIM